MDRAFIVLTRHPDFACGYKAVKRFAARGNAKGRIGKDRVGFASYLRRERAR